MLILKHMVNSKFNIDLSKFKKVHVLGNPPFSLIKKSDFKKSEFVFYKQTLSYFESS